MVRGFQIVGVLAVLFFAHAQYQGWSLFDREAGSQAARHSGSSGRISHK